MSQQHRTVLLVEDNNDDIFLMRRALKHGGIANPLQVVTDGQQAVDYLAGARQFADRQQFPLPFLIFLDLKLPYVDGFEVLAWIRRQPQLNSALVIVLTSSAEPRDKDRAYALGARSYLTKPPDGQQLRELVNSLESYWLATGATSPINLEEPTVP